MSTTIHKLSFGLLVLLAASFAACGSDSKESAPPDDGGPGGFTDDASTPEKDSGAPTPKPDAGEDAGPENCEADGCYSCKPTESEQFLNACTDNSCRPFDNKKRLTLLKPDGSLPDLP